MTPDHNQRMSRWGPAPKGAWPAACTPEREYEPIGGDLAYERYVEVPRRQGIDPVWQSLMAQALGDYPQPIHRAG